MCIGGMRRSGARVFHLVVLFELCGQIDGIAYDCVLKPLSVADDAEQHRTAGDARSSIRRFPATLESGGAPSIDCVKRGVDRAQCIGGAFHIGCDSTEARENAVAQKLVDACRHATR